MLRTYEASGRCLGMMLLGFAAISAPAEARAQFGEQPATPPTATAEGERPDPPPLAEPELARRLDPADRVWVDPKNKLVYVDGYIALQKGYLEMFACPAGTKEHESVIGVHAKAATVHAALLAIGAREGHPVRFRPKFEPPEGTEIDIEVRWPDAAGAWQTARAQEWIREVESKKEMSQVWVFAGSGFWTDEETSKRYYMAEQGDLICVSNFTTATLDVPIESSQSNEGLLFEANPDKVPPLGTQVRLVLKPVLDQERAQPAAAQPTGEGTEPAAASGG
jgi:hypothetical protein